MRLFSLVRDTDVTGVSGTGTVAEGAEFSDGVVVLRWVGKNPTSVVFHDNGIESVKAIHGHDGKTYVVYEFGPTDSVEIQQDMIAALDRALHGHSYARDMSPQEVWQGLLGEVRKFRNAN